MKKTLSLLTIVLLSLVLVMPANAAVKKVAQTGLQFLKIDMSARSAGMGNAFIMVGDDANAMFYNPAGTAKHKSGFDAFVTSTQWVADISYTAAGILFGMGELGTVGVNFVTADYGDIQGTVVSSVEAGYITTGMLDVGAYAVGATYSRQLTDKFLMGGQIRYATQHLGSSTLPEVGDTTYYDVENEVSGLAYEAGTIFYPGLYNSLRIGMSIKNFSPQFKYQEEAFQLPIAFVMGAAVDVFEILGMGGSNTLLVAFDALHPRDYTERIHLGAEFGFLDMAFLRGGYKTNYDVESFSLGGGLKLAMSGFGLKIDVAYSDADVFGSVMRFTIGASF